MLAYRNLRPYASVESGKSSSLSKKKLSVVTPAKKKKLSTAVSYKNEFRKALLCKY